MAAAGSRSWSSRKRATSMAVIALERGVSPLTAAAMAPAQEDEGRSFVR